MLVEVGGDKLGQGWMQGYQQSFSLGQSREARRALDRSLTDALRTGHNVDPVTFAVPSTPISSVWMIPGADGWVVA